MNRAKAREHPKIALTMIAAAILGVQSFGAADTSTSLAVDIGLGPKSGGEDWHQMAIWVQCLARLRGHQDSRSTSYCSNQPVIESFPACQAVEAGAQIRWLRACRDSVDARSSRFVFRGKLGHDTHDKE